MTVVLITGASSGIGASFAEAFAAKGDDVILVARSEATLQALAERLRQAHGIKADVLVQDLATPEGAQQTAEAVKALGTPVDVLINNAGFGDYGLFSDRPRDKQLDMIRLNVLALTDLTYQFLPEMIERRSGHIINVASIAAFQPIPYLSVYAATKAFVLSFSEALWAEVKPFGVKVLSVCPGPTDTQFAQVAAMPDEMGQQSAQNLMTPEQVVQETLKAMNDDSPNLVNGGPLNQFIVNLSRFLPRSVIVSMIEQQFRPVALK